MKTFSTYSAAYEWAQSEAGRTGLSLGISREGFDAFSTASAESNDWAVFYIPRDPSQRFGRDAQVQPVDPS